MKKRTVEELQARMMVFCLMEAEARELGEEHFAHRCDQAIEACYNLLQPLF